MEGGAFAWSSSDSLVASGQRAPLKPCFAGEGKVASHFSWDSLDNINAIFDRMKAGQIEGRVVMRI
jgi:propanol-preferring alcohol dehydrogenase